MKGLNYIGAILGTSVLLVPWTGITLESFHFIYGMLYLLYVSVYAGFVITSLHPVPGLRVVELNFGRGAINMIMFAMVMATLVYAGYGVQNWLMIGFS